MRAVIPEVLRLIGEAAGVDRVNLMLSEKGPMGQPLLVLASEWVAEGVAPHLEQPCHAEMSTSATSRLSAASCAPVAGCVSARATIRRSSCPSASKV